MHRYGPDMGTAVATWLLDCTLFGRCSSNLCVSGMVVLVMANGVGLRSERTDSQTCVGKKIGCARKLSYPISGIHGACSSLRWVFLPHVVFRSIFTDPNLGHKSLGQSWGFTESMLRPCLFVPCFAYFANQAFGWSAQGKTPNHTWAVTGGLGNLCLSELGWDGSVVVSTGVYRWKMVKDGESELGLVTGDYWKTTGFIEAPPYDKSVVVY